MVFYERDYFLVNSMTPVEITNILDNEIYQRLSTHFTDLEREIFLKLYQDPSLNYGEIAGQLRFAEKFIQDTGSRMFRDKITPTFRKNKTISLGEKVTRYNFRGKIQNFLHPSNQSDSGLEYFDPDPPSDRSSSRLYVQRDSEEQEFYNTITTSGALVRIKAPEKFGKTRFINTLLDQIREKGYQYIVLDFQSFDAATLSDITLFSTRFCSTISLELGLANELDKYWEKSVSPIYNVKTYFQNYIFKKITATLVLVLSHVDEVFEKSISNDFCSLIRVLNDSSRTINPHRKSWENLRWVISHSTDVYAELDINYSPLNGIGTTISLDEFSEKQIKMLVDQYQLNWDIAKVHKLMELVGGHPYLVSLALENIAKKVDNLDNLLTEASNNNIYNEYLGKLFGRILKHENLVTTLKKIVTDDKPVQLQDFHQDVFKLEAMGLIVKQGDYSILRCKLFKHYFRKKLPKN